MNIKRIIDNKRRVKDNDEPVDFKFLWEVIGGFYRADGYLTSTADDLPYRLRFDDAWNALCDDMKKYDPKILQRIEHLKDLLVEAHSEMNGIVRDIEAFGASKSQYGKDWHWKEDIY